MRIPAFIPRKREEFKEFIALLDSKGITLKGSGRTRDPKTEFNMEAEAAYKKFRKEQFEIRCLKIEGAKLSPLLTEFAGLPPLRTKTAKILMPLLVGAFLDTHTRKPEKSPELLRIVKLRVNKSSSLKSNAPTAPKEYRNEIKKDFRKAVRLLAKEMTTLLGD
jgi:hypothetical protein